MKTFKLRIKDRHCKIVDKLASEINVYALMQVTRGLSFDQQQE